MAGPVAGDRGPRREAVFAPASACTPPPPACSSRLRVEPPQPPPPCAPPPAGLEAPGAARFLPPQLEDRLPAGRTRIRVATPGSRVATRILIRLPGRRAFDPHPGRPGRTLAAFMTPPAPAPDPDRAALLAVRFAPPLLRALVPDLERRDPRGGALLGHGHGQPRSDAGPPADGVPQAGLSRRPVRPFQPPARSDSSRPCRSGGGGAFF